MRFKHHMLSWFAVILAVIGLTPMRTNAESSLPYLELTRPDRGKVFAVAWSPDGQYVAVGTEQGLWLYTDTFADVLHVADQPIHALAWSPDGQVIATGYFGKLADTEAPRAQASDPPTYLMQGGGLRLWSVKNIDQHLTLASRATLLKDGSVYALRFSPDGSALVSLSQDRYLRNWQDVLRIYEAESGKLLHEFEAETWLHQNEAIAQSANGLAWSSDGRYLATIRSFSEDENEHFSIWDSVREQFVTRPGVDDCGQLIGSLTAVDWSNGNSQIALSGVFSYPTSEGGVRVGYWGDRQAACQKLPLLSPSSDGVAAPDVYVLAWRPGSQWLAYADQAAIQLWDAATNRPVAVLDAAREAVTMLAWNPDGSELLTAGSDYAVRIWTRFDLYQSPDPRPVRETRLAAGHAHGILSPDGQRLVEVNETSGLVEVIDAVTGSVYRSFEARADNVLEQAPQDLPQAGLPEEYFIQWSPDGSMLAIPLSPDPQSVGCGSLSQQTVQLWSVQTGKLLRSWDGITSLAWRPDSRAAAVGTVESFEWHGSKPGEVTPLTIDSFEVRDIQAGQVIEKAPPGQAWGDMLSPSRYADVNFTHRFSVSGWSPDGRLLAIGDSMACGVSDSTSAILWDTQTHTLAAQLEAWPGSTFSGSGGNSAVVAWSPDGNTVVVSGVGEIFLYRLHQQGSQVTPELIWNRSSNSPLYAADFSNNIPFSPDSRYFLFGGTVWDTVSGWPVFRFRARMPYRTYRWVGDTLTGYDFGFAGDNTPGKAVSWRASDFLPQTGQ